VVVYTLALLVAAHAVPGISLAGLGSALAAGVVLGIINAVVRPILVVITFPITLLTLGIFLLVLNAFCLKLVSFFEAPFQLRAAPLVPTLTRPVGAAGGTASATGRIMSFSS